MDNVKKQIIDNINKGITDLENKDFTLYFFVIDSDNVPNGSMEYIYRMAKTLHDNGYKVKMVYQLENEYTAKELKKLRQKEENIDENRVFHGVGEWLGEEYANLPHSNILTSQWSVGPADFLFIPEVFSSLMKQTYKFNAPCKRIVVLHNYNYITEFIPFGDEWGTYGIYDVITNTQSNANDIQDIFPYVKTNILQPYISGDFRDPIKPQKLIVNLICKNPDDINRIMKQFYWRFPVYKFVSFRDIRNFPKKTFAEMLKESAITVWVDPETPFGESALEAMRCGNIVIGKVPERVPDWMTNPDGTLKDNGIWTYDINSIPQIIARVIGSWMQDKIPETILENMKETNKCFTEEEWNKNCVSIIENYVTRRIEDMKQIVIGTTTSDEEKEQPKKEQK